MDGTDVSGDGLARASTHLLERLEKRGQGLGDPGFTVEHEEVDGLVRGLPRLLRSLPARLPRGNSI